MNTTAFGMIGFVMAFAGSLICWLLAMVNMFRAVRYRKDGVPLFRNWYESPFNILFRPADLTDRGLAARRWFFYGFAGFILCILVGVAIGYLTGAAHS